MGEIDILMHIYAFTINQVPHVFGDHCFAGLKHGYCGKYIKRHIPTRYNADMRNKINKKA
jgi:hypothetical protein